MKKVKLTTYAKLNDVTPRTVWNWIKKGLIKYERTETNRILIIIIDKLTKIIMIPNLNKFSNQRNKYTALQK